MIMTAVVDERRPAARKTTMMPAGSVPADSCPAATGVTVHRDGLMRSVPLLAMPGEVSTDCAVTRQRATGRSTSMPSSACRTPSPAYGAKDDAAPAGHPLSACGERSRGTRRSEGAAAALRQAYEQRSPGSRTAPHRGRSADYFAGLYQPSRPFCSFSASHFRRVACR